MERWSSRTAFILASVGSAVGIGNIWRFSSLVGQNGGGAYLIPYLIAVFVFALPLMILELAVGRRLRGDVVTAFGRARPKFRPLGWVVCAVVFSILSYYLVVTGWTLAYVEFSAAGRSVEFSDFTTSYDPILYFIISAVMMGAIVSLGIKNGIERFTKLLVPLSFLLLLGLFAFSSTLPGFGDGIRFLFTPDFSVLADPLLWGAAFGQAFFSLSVGYGILLTYGDYLDEDVKLFSSSLIITIADLTVAILAGMVIFPVVFTYGLEPSAGAELAFTTLPRAFEVMPYGQVFAVAFFALLFFAAMTSAVSMLEVSAASASRAFNVSRRGVSLVLTAAVIGLGLPSALSYSAADLRFQGIRILDIMDETVGGFGLVLTATLIAVTFTWLLDDELLRREIGRGSRLILPMVKYAVPAVLALTLATGAFF
ncbi:sodium-dependent transporter [Methanotrichaceae archaeon M04Ac]|uniref:Sodium-dependent transporter n=1 Tax=Candidatus Methanocrinis alkalitolerans TaxID=3033395 RepID=A0ABT5XGU6_9EURY|nr:sodium-dependent transporter [Candidatus Methanocrinis alkalitolerans]MCR3883661.1 sodium-dependent transporter [Methanothrix sp.]MDF0593945.1 sodium-dependent transporter [Candidatus Methanocrinis alkalitolerans]